MGAYEFDLRTVVPSDWFAQHNLDASDPYVLSGNPDDDGQTSFQEWLAGRIPAIRCRSSHRGGGRGTAGQAVLSEPEWPRLQPVRGFRVGGRVRWNDVLAPVPASSRLPGSGGLDWLTDTNTLPQSFYRVGVELP